VQKDGRGRLWRGRAFACGRRRSRQRRRDRAENDDVLETGMMDGVEQVAAWSISRTGDQPWDDDGPRGVSLPVMRWRLTRRAWASCRVRRTVATWCLGVEDGAGVHLRRQGAVFRFEDAGGAVVDAAVLVVVGAQPGDLSRSGDTRRRSGSFRRPSTGPGSGPLEQTGLRSGRGRAAALHGQQHLGCRERGSRRNGPGSPRHDVRSRARTRLLVSSQHPEEVPEHGQGRRPLPGVDPVRR